MTRFARFAVLLLIAAAALAAQDLKPRPRSANEYCSGTVIALSADQLTVRRTLSTRATEDRPFLLKPETKIDGTLALNARVTVAFLRTPDGQVARHIVVRGARPK